MGGSWKNRVKSRLKIHDTYTNMLIYMYIRWRNENLSKNFKFLLNGKSAGQNGDISREEEEYRLGPC
jgi:hypothetical protein